MTHREFLNAVANAPELAGEIAEMAKAEIAKLDARNEKRRTTPSKTQIANEPLKAAALELLENGPMTAADAGAALEVSTAKASAILRGLATEGAVVATDIKVKGKSGTVKSYSLN